MKASVKLRDGKQPLVRAKLPLNLLGLPVLSGISIGSKDELGLHLGTLFEAGPACRLTYRPNDAANSISLLVKTGFGLWGSPADAALIMAAEFNLSYRGTPSFAVQVKPKLGHFNLRKDANSQQIVHEKKDYQSQTPEKIELKEEHLMKASCIHGLGGSGIDSPPSRKIEEHATIYGPNIFEAENILSQSTGSVSASSDDSCVMVKMPEEDGRDYGQQQQQKQEHLEADSKMLFDNLSTSNYRDDNRYKGSDMAGWNLIARTAVPLGRQAVANIRWRVRMPSDILNNLQSQPQSLSLLRLPVLVMDKVSLECNDRRGGSPQLVVLGGSSSSGGGGGGGGEVSKVAAMCSSMKRQLHLLYVENRVLRKTLEEMKCEMTNRRPNSSVGMVSVDNESVGSDVDEDQVESAAAAVAVAAVAASDNTA